MADILLSRWPDLVETFHYILLAIFAAKQVSQKPNQSQK